MADVVEIAESQKARLLQRERRASSELVRAYGVVYQRLQARVSLLTGEIEAAKLQGEISSSFLYERDRLARLSFEIESEMRGFALFATARVTSEHRAAVRLAVVDAQAILNVSAGAKAAQSAASFVKPNLAAIEAMAGRASDGSPLAELFKPLGAALSRGVRDELIAGVAQGAPARVIAERIRTISGVPLGRSLVISRHEVLTAYRTVTLDSYKTSGVVLSWRWQATKSARTCIVCWLMDGREFPLSTPMRPHISCRCTLVPVTENTSPAEEGANLFTKQDEGFQLSVLGKAKFEAFKSGKLQIQNLIGVKRSEQWGMSLYERSLKDAL